MPALEYDGEQPQYGEDLVALYPELAPDMVESRYSELYIDEDGQRRKFRVGYPSSEVCFAFFTGFCDVRKAFPKFQGQTEDWARLINAANANSDRMEVTANAIGNLLALMEHPDRDWVLKTKAFCYSPKGPIPRFVGVAKRLGVRVLPRKLTVKVPATEPPEPTNDPAFDAHSMETWRNAEELRQARVPKKVREAMTRVASLEYMKGQQHGTCVKKVKQLDSDNRELIVENREILRLRDILGKQLTVEPRKAEREKSDKPDKEPDKAA